MKPRGEYNDIINLPRPKSKHEPMPMSDRAAQFSPFAALTGYEDAIGETARLTDARVELGESAVEELERKLKNLASRLADRPTASITYFIPDERKDGGAYVTYTGTLKSIDELGRELVFTDMTRIPIGDIVFIEDNLTREDLPT